MVWIKFIFPVKLKRNIIKFVFFSLLYSDTKPGHIPGATSLPFSEIQGPAIYEGEEFPNGAMKSTEELKKVFAEKNINLDKPLTATCGSGIYIYIYICIFHLLSP